MNKIYTDAIEVAIIDMDNDGVVPILMLGIKKGTWPRELMISVLAPVGLSRREIKEILLDTAKSVDNEIGYRKKRSSHE